jgi:hypothetical protein
MCMWQRIIRVSTIFTLTRVPSMDRSHDRNRPSGTGARIGYGGTAQVAVELASDSERGRDDGRGRARLLPPASPRLAYPQRNTSTRGWWLGLDGVEHTGGPMLDFDGEGRPKIGPLGVRPARLGRSATSTAMASSLGRRGGRHRRPGDTSKPMRTCHCHDQYAPTTVGPGNAGRTL